GLHKQLEVEIGEPRARGLLVEADPRAIEPAAHRRRRRRRRALTPFVAGLDPPAIFYRRRRSVGLVAHAALLAARVRTWATALPSIRAGNVSALRSASAKKMYCPISW